MSTSLSLDRRRVTAVDPDASQVPSWTISGAVWVSIGATCAQSSGSITFRLVFCDANGNLTGVAPPFTMTSGSGPADWGSAWLGTPQGSSLESIPVCADRMILKIDSIVGTWMIAAQSFIPPGSTSS